MQRANLGAASFKQSTAQKKTEITKTKRNQKRQNQHQTHDNLSPYPTLLRPQAFSEPLSSSG